MLDGAQAMLPPAARDQASKLAPDHKYLGTGSKLCYLVASSKDSIQSVHIDRASVRHPSHLGRSSLRVAHESRAHESCVQAVWLTCRVPGSASLPSDSSESERPAISPNPKPMFVRLDARMRRFYSWVLDGCPSHRLDCLPNIFG